MTCAVAEEDSRFFGAFAGRYPPGIRRGQNLETPRLHGVRTGRGERKAKDKEDTRQAPGLHVSHPPEVDVHQVCGSAACYEPPRWLDDAVDPAIPNTAVPGGTGCTRWIANLDLIAASHEL